MIFLGIAGGCAVLEWFFTKHINVSGGRTAKASYEFFSLTHLLKYQVFFYLGAAVKAFDTAFWRMLSRKGIAVLIVAATIVVFKVVPRFRVPLEIFYGAACMGILFSLTLFFYLRKVFSRSIALCNLLKYIGKNTLPIYLFHYFIIKLLHDVNIPQFDNLIKGSVWFEIPVITLISLMIVLTVLGIDRLLKIKPRLHRIIFSV